MGKIERFEDIQAWQLARQLTRQVYKLSDVGHLVEILACGIRFGERPFLP